MPVSIQLNDMLAAQLQEKAAARRLSLLHKSYTSGLSSQEQAELQGLQAALDQRLEPVDDRLLDTLRQWQTSAARLPGNGTD